MKAFEDVKKDIEKQGFGDVYTIKDFRHYVSDGFFIKYDGNGYLHDGENETDICVWNIDLFDNKYNKYYPYVIWYNK